jgi:VanZ family protein
MRSVFFYKPAPVSSRHEGDWLWWFKVWTPVLIAIAVICFESTNTFSSEHTGRWLRPIVQRLFGVMSDGTWDLFHHYLRKAGHFVGYGTVGFTFLRAWLHTLGRRGPTSLLSWRVESSILAILSTAIVAIGDEFHQTFIPSRTGTPLDVILDTCGACAMSLFVWLICWSKRKQEEVW